MHPPSNFKLHLDALDFRRCFAQKRSLSD